MSQVTARWLPFGKAIAIGLASVTLAAPFASAADLTVTVEGVHGRTGDVVLGLFNDSSEWPQGKATYKVKVAPADGQATYIFENLSPGRYALTGFYDENDDGKMDYSFIGLPEEGFLFSNDKSPGLSTPSFEACAIAIAQAPVAITVHIQHWGG